MNFIEHLLSVDELGLYSSTEYPFNLSILHSALKKRLKEEPGYEVWVPLVYYVCQQYKRSSKTPSIIAPYKVFISNRGSICNLRDGTPKVSNHLKNEDGYVLFSAPVDKKGRSLFLHRALACSFLSLDEYLLANEGVSTAHPKDLQVNHIDGIKGNFFLTNLEWATQSGNMLHAQEVGLKSIGSSNSCTKAVKGTVAFGSFKGLEFILHGPRDIKRYGFGQPNIVACCKGRKNSHRNCTWGYATSQEIESLPVGVSDEVLASLLTRPQKILDLYS